MEVTIRTKTIKLSKEEKETISKATDILLRVMYEIDEGYSLFGYSGEEWDKICNCLEKVSETGKFEIK